LQARLHPAESRIRKLAVETPAQLILFDILLAPDGTNLIPAPLSQRRKALEALGDAIEVPGKLILSSMTRERRVAERWLHNAGHGDGPRHIHRAAALVTAAIENLKQSTPGLVSVVAAGDIRRGSELVADLAVVAEVKRLKGAPKVVNSGELSVYVTDARLLGVSMLLATGSRRHIEALGQRAVNMGMALSRSGVYRGRKIVASRTETAIYDALGLQYIEPEMREGLDEIELAAAGRIPHLVTVGDLHGVLHAHTVASDGVDTLEAMAEASRRQGYSYIGVTDHSKTAHYAGGLSVA
jgi:DNA polymerase (family 10)